MMRTCLTITAICLLLSCGTRPEKKVALVLKNKNNMTAVFIPEGARLVSLTVPDKNGKMTGVVVGFDSAQQYAASAEPYFGATIGRYGNRIKEGKFTLEGKAYQLTINNGPNTLHGGTHGFQSKEWEVVQPDDHTVVFARVSKDGEEGFPGNHFATRCYLSNEVGVCIFG